MKRFKELPLQEFDASSIATYVIDYDWTFLYVNPTALKHHGSRKMVGKHLVTIWDENKPFNFKPIYGQLHKYVQQRMPFTLREVSPINGRFIIIEGSPYIDCYYFTISSR